MEKKMPGRFDYVKYDEQSAVLSGVFKIRFEALAQEIEQNLPKGRAQEYALESIEAGYMWVGKAIRDDQVAKRGAELQEGRSNA